VSPRTPEGRPGIAHDVDAELLVLQRRDPRPGTGNTVLVAVCLVVAAVGSLTFAAAILLDGPVGLQGTALGVAMLALAVALRRIFASTYPNVTAVERRHSPEPEGGALTPVTPVNRRSFLTRMLVGVGGLLGLSLFVPLSSLGDPRSGVMSVTGWREGVRLVDPDGNPLRADDVVGAGQATVWPEDAPQSEISSVILVRLTERTPQEPTNLDWVVDGQLVAYSKICTHTGCPVGLLRTEDSELYCPCHQAQFDATRAAEPTFGPAARPLPQLPMGVDDEGYLIALGDFTQPVGPAVG
jgi:ubiquinol-cytochrome c reductase iron-sulfur subunit